MPRYILTTPTNESVGTSQDGSGTWRLAVESVTAPGSTTTVAQTDPTKLNVTTTPAAGSTTTVVQPTAANLNATVTQTDPTKFAVTTTPAAGSTTTVVQPTASNLNALAAQGQATASLTNAWPVKITDGTNVAAVRAGGSLASASDPSTVVQISPNQQPIPVITYGTQAKIAVVVGHVLTGAAGTFTAVNWTPYTPPSVNGQRSFKSSSANDTAAGTGARQVEITYLDQNCAGPYTTTVTLNGTTAVATAVSNICFIQKMTVTSVGSNKSNVGTISLYTANNGTGSVIWSIGLGSITAGRGDNSTIGGFFYVPVGRRANIWSLTGTSIPKSTTLTMVTLTKNPTDANSPEIFLGDHVITSSAFTVVRIHQVPVQVTGPAVVQAYASTDNNVCDVYMGLDYSEEAA